MLNVFTRWRPGSEVLGLGLPPTLTFSFLIVPLLKKTKRKGGRRGRRANNQTYVQHVVGVHRSLSVPVSDCGDRCDSNDPEFLNDASLPPMPCFSERELNLTLSFSLLLLLLSLSLSSLEVYQFRPRAVPPSGLMFTAASAWLTTPCWISPATAESGPRYDFLSFPPPGRKVELSPPWHSHGRQRRHHFWVLLPRSPMYPSPQLPQSSSSLLLPLVPRSSLKKCLPCSNVGRLSLLLLQKDGCFCP